MKHVLRQTQSRKALAGGADFDALAKRYGQTGEKVWFTGQQYEMAPSMNQDNRTFVKRSAQW